MFDINYIRNKFSLCDELIYLNNAATGSLPDSTVSAINEYLKQRQCSKINNWEWILGKKDRLRYLFGKIINSQPDRVAILQNTSQGINTIASGLDWHEGDEILIPEREFPANVYPFLNLREKGVKVKFLPKPEGGLTQEVLNKNITERTKMLSASFVDFITGYRINLKEIGEICHNNDIIFFVDGIQGVGVIPVDVEEAKIDALACGGHKWLLCPQGVGFLYVSKRLQRIIKQKFVGWTSVKDPEDFLNYNQKLTESARRYELGSFNSAGIVGGVASLELLLEVGIDNIYNYVMALIDLIYDNFCREGLKLNSNMDRNVRSGIVSFYPHEKRKSELLISYLRKNNIEVSMREGVIRVSPHFYNTIDEINKFLEVCKEFLKLEVA